MKKTDKDAVIDAALNLFRMNGYHNTSMADISAACGLLKGSIYHYFPGKKELALAALDRVIAETREKLFRPALDSTVPANVRLATLADRIERYFIGREGGCLMGNLALEVGDAIPEFQERIRTYFKDWKQALATLLAERHGQVRAEELAEDIVARVQGAVMMLGVNKDERPLRRASRETVQLLA
ncbi:MAG: TetR/AcrR family transcriptional regulator [Rhodospirillaceae bacterium]|nr:TetR/AcrR family transcriptional regulator [Rhodospirillaceae bacterium]